MKRILVAALMAAAVGQAREVESSLATMRQRLENHAVVQRELSARQHRAAMMSAALAETAAALERMCCNFGGEWLVA